MKLGSFFAFDRRWSDVLVMLVGISLPWLWRLRGLENRAQCIAMAVSVVIGVSFHDAFRKHRSISRIQSVAWLGWMAVAYLAWASIQLSKAGGL